MATAVHLFRQLKIQAAMGTPRLSAQGHPSFLGGAIPFFNIAANTGRQHIFPSVTAPARSRNDVVEGEVIASIGAILTGMIIPIQDIFTGQGNLLVGDFDVVT